MEALSFGLEREPQYHVSNTSNRGDGKQPMPSDKPRPELVFANKERLGTSTEKSMAQAGKKMGLIPKYFKRCLHVFYLTVFIS